MQSREGQFDSSVTQR
nr:unnamed protein product [Callosobruchus chinensis]